MISSEHSPIRIVLVDDHPIILSGLRGTLASYPQCEVVGDALNGLEAIEKVKSLLPDVVLMDIVMPGMNGIQATKIFQKEVPGVNILALSMHDEKEYIVEMVRAGARGYVLKDATPSELLFAVETVARGDAYFSPSISKILLKEMTDEPAAPARRSTVRLSPRETEVLRHIATGLSNRQIAELIFVSLRTVETHRERIMKKLDIHSAAGLTRYAILNGIVQLDK